MDLIANGQVDGSLAFFNGTTWEALPTSSDGYILTTHGSGADPTWNDQLTLALTNTFFGDGYDGDLSLSSGVINLNRDTYYRNITLSGTGSINTNGFRLFISNVLDLSNAPISAIQFNGLAGSNAFGTTGGTGGLGLTTRMIGGSGAGISGVNGSNSLNAPNINDNNLVATDLSWSSNGGFSGHSAPGGDGNGSGLRQTLGSRGASAYSFADNSDYGPITFCSFTKDLNGSRYYATGASSTVPLLGGAGGSGGSNGKGGSSGTSMTGAGGGGGSGGGVVFISAKTIIRGVSTAASCISAIGGSGGNGGNASGSASSIGAGGGGSGGGGGFIYLCYYNLVGTSVSNLIDVSGGVGGSGGTGVGGSLNTGGGGAGGAYGGFIQILNLKSNVSLRSAYINNPNFSDNTAVQGSGSTGATGAVGNSTKMSL